MSLVAKIHEHAGVDGAAEFFGGTAKTAIKLTKREMAAVRGGEYVLTRTGRNSYTLTDGEYIYTIENGKVTSCNTFD